MIKFPTFVLAACVLAACSGNPFDQEDTGGTGGGTTAPTPAPDPSPSPIGDGSTPPGTTSPAPNTAIVRYEARGTGAADGNGFANGFRYDSGSDTFYVQGLAFDGDQPTGTPYTRVETAPGVPLPLGTGFAAYEGPSTVPDFLTGAPITQLTHRAIYRTSTSGRTQLAIVRTGSYAGYGFGGYVYQRNQIDSTGVVLPTLPSQGQALYEGEYAGLRDFNGSGGLEYVTGDMEMTIDFDGFSGNCTPARCSDAVRGTVSNRQVFDLDGTNVTANIVGAINTEENAALIGLPVLRFRIGTGVLDVNGEIRGTLNSNFSNLDGRTVAYEEGNYYAIMAGDHTAGAGGEIVGIIVVEGNERRAPGTTFRETGGFIVERAVP
ncbi:MAG: hypothetical protein ACU0A4_16590 [Paracoccaceae bacterium]